MSTSMRKILLTISVLLIASLACYLLPGNQPSNEELGMPPDPTENSGGVLPSATDETSESVQQQPTTPAATQLPTQPGESPGCVWVLTETKEALATGGGAPGMSVTTGEWTMKTSYTFPGNQGCPDQTFNTGHAWAGLDKKLTPGTMLTLSLLAQFDLAGSAECASLVAGIGTYLYLPGTTLKVVVDQVDVPLLSEKFNAFGEWEVISGESGDTLKIKANGSAGALGGSIFYTYTCQAR
jgi:hypothetical protein